MSALNTIADRQAGWSVTANALKATLDRARWAIFLFSILGALLAALASQWPPPAAAGPNAAGIMSDPRTWLALVGALSLATATFFTQRLLGQSHVAAWVRARAISEALKREAFKYCTEAAPYDKKDNAETLLNEERQKIEADGNDLLGSMVTTEEKGSLPRTKLSSDEYVKQRVDGQIAFYTERADRYSKIAWWLRAAELVLALAATLITAVASVTGNHVFGFQFDIAALTAVLTTVAGAVLAHVEASRFDFLVTTYRAAARRLQDRKDGAMQPLSDFVNDCEKIIETENTSWIAKWSGPQTG